MEITVSIPEEVYRFYENASKFIAEHSPEDIMADALAAYAGLPSPGEPRPSEGNSSQSRS